MTAPILDLDALLDDREVRILVCCGSGGVGKTTTAAALAVRAAERGRDVVVLTIDPARRLAQSMGLTELDNVPRVVDGVDTSAGGSLEAMMLDMKRTFDEIVLDHADPVRAQQILDNPFYQSLSSSMAGTQEYMAMEKLGQLRRGDEWDLIVVDTPPSRSALDFLDAPKRLGSFLDGRVIRILAAPAKAGGRGMFKVVSAGFNIVTNVVTKVLGAQLLKDVSAFIAALDTMFGGFRERADATYKLLKNPETRFLVVAAPESDALREASYFVERLSAERMPLAGLVLNRVHRSDRRHADRVPIAGRGGGPGGGLQLRCRPGSGRRTAAPARRSDEFDRPGTAPHRPLHRRPPRGRHRRGAGPSGRCARPRGPTNNRRRSSLFRLNGESALLHPFLGEIACRCALSDKAVRELVAQIASGSDTGRPESASSRAVSSRPRQEVTFGRRRSSARRSRSVIPPQTPNSTRLSRASARHSVRTGQPMQTALARFCAAPCTNSSSGADLRHWARCAHSLSHIKTTSFPLAYRPDGPRSCYAERDRLKSRSVHNRPRCDQRRVVRRGQ